MPRRCGFVGGAVRRSGVESESQGLRRVARPAEQSRPSARFHLYRHLRARPSFCIHGAAGTLETRTRLRAALGVVPLFTTRGGALRRAAIRPVPCRLRGAAGGHEPHSAHDQATAQCVFALRSSDGNGGRPEVQQESELPRVAGACAHAVGGHGCAGGHARALPGALPRSVVPGSRMRRTSRAKSTRSAQRVQQVAYTVRSGDSLWTIARKHGTTVEVLQRTNGIRGSRIYEGQVLDLPGSR